LRERLNKDPKAQGAVVLVLVVIGALMLLKSGSGGGSEEAATPAPTVATVNGVTATGSTPGAAIESAIASLPEGGGGAAASGELPASVPAPPPPPRLAAAYDAGKTVVLLVVHNGGVDDAFTAAAASPLVYVHDVALFVVPVGRIARYAAVTVGLDLNRVPALVVMRPRRLSGGVPQATVDYGFQTPQSVAQAVRDAAYKGPEGTYYPN
jgi:hypothetical protein